MVAKAPGDYDSDNFKLGILTDLYYNRINSSADYSIDNLSNTKWWYGTNYFKINYIAANTSLSGIFNINKNRNFVLACLGLNMNFKIDNNPIKIYNKYIYLSFNLGYSFNFKNISIIPEYHQPFFLINRPGTKLDKLIANPPVWSELNYKPDFFQQTDVGLRVFYTFPEKKPQNNK